MYLPLTFPLNIHDMGLFSFLPWLILMFTSVSALWTLPRHSFAPRKAHSRACSTYLHGVAKYDVTIKHEGRNRKVQVTEDQSILEAGLDAGLDLPHDCKLGVCLRCSAKVISGDVDQTGTTLDDSVVQQGYALTCMIFPRSDCVIECIDEGELVNAQFSGR